MWRGKGISNQLQGNTARLQQYRDERSIAKEEGGIFLVFPEEKFPPLS
jgi:hypothetical protein